MNLPPNWRTDPSLKAHLPSSVDWKSFKRLTESPERYAACVRGTGVFDLLRNRFLSPIRDAKSNRVRYRINRTDHAHGKTATATTLFYSRIICTLAYGPASRAREGHHVNHDRTDDRWENLAWEVPTNNRALAQKHAKRKGTDNPNFKMYSNEVAEFIWNYDREMRRRGTVNLLPFSKKYQVSERQLRRIANAQTRTEEVLSLRKMQDKARAADPDVEIEFS